MSAEQVLTFLVWSCFAQVWLNYVPHFKSIPEPPVSQPQELLLRSRDYLPPSGLGISSYDSRHASEVTLQQALLDIKYAL